MTETLTDPRIAIAAAAVEKLPEHLRDIAVADATAVDHDPGLHDAAAVVTAYDRYARIVFTHAATTSEFTSWNGQGRWAAPTAAHAATADQAIAAVADWLAAA